MTRAARALAEKSAAQRWGRLSYRRGIEGRFASTAACRLQETRAAAPTE